MRYVPRTPDASVNVSRTHPLAEAGTLILGLSIATIAILVLLFYSVELLVRFVPPATEARWFSGWTPIEADAPAAPDELAAAALLERMTAHWPDAPGAFRLGVMDESTPNAFALPGGLVVVTRGLLDTVRSENALAFVLAHELGHFRHRDHVRQFGRITAIGLFLTAVGTSNGAGMGTTIADLTLRGFGRAQESRADAFALDLVMREYGHVAAADRFFASLEASGAPDWTGYLATHPLPTDRVRDLGALAEEAGWPATGDVRPWPPGAAPD